MVRRGRRRLIDLLQWTLTECESTKWAAQNVVGVIIPLLFLLLDRLTFSAACSSAIFYAMCSLAFTLDRSTGGRLFPGLVFVAACLVGGLLGFAVVSLSWLGRGSTVPLQGLSGLTPADADTAELSSTFFVLLMVLHLVFYMWLTYMRATTTGLNNVYVTILISVVSAVTMMGLFLMPSVGQYKFWTNVYSSVIKSSLVTLLGMTANAMILYVKSSHDKVREQLGDVFLEMGKLLSKCSSGFHLAVDLYPSPDVYGNWITSTSRVISCEEIARMSVDAKQTCAMCAFEPPWPVLFCSQPGADFVKYMDVIKKVQSLLENMSSLESITSAMMKEMSRVQYLTDETGNLLRTGSYVLATMAGVMSELDAPLRCMKSYAYADVVHWKPHSLQFWDTQMKVLNDCINSSIAPLKKSALDGVAYALRKPEELMSDKNTFNGSGVGLLVLVEGLIDECILLEIAVAHALDISDGDLHTNCDAKPAKCGIKELITNPWIRAIVINVFEGSGMHMVVLLVKSSVKGIRSLLSVTAPQKNTDVSDADKILISSRKMRVWVKCLKLILGMNLAVIAVILIGWYEEANTGNYVTDAKNLVSWYRHWSPHYFAIATSVLIQDTVDGTIVKIILRVTLIAVGGSLGFATVSNGSLAQNEYYIFFITWLVTGFVGLFGYLGYNFRYSLFLMTYQWSGVALCVYTGVCCTAGSAQKFIGRTFSTMIGAVYAFCINTIIFPVYSSHVVFELEGSLLAAYGKILAASHRKGVALLESQTNIPSDGVSVSSNYPNLGHASPEKDVSALQRNIEDAAVQRLDIIKELYGEIEDKSMDSYQFMITKLTMIPLPKSVRLVFLRIVKIGAFSCVSVQSLRSQYMRRSGKVSLSFMEQMLNITDTYIQASSDVCIALMQILVRKRIVEEDLDELRSKLQILESNRKDVLDAYLRILPSLETIKEWSDGDLRGLVWYTMNMLAIKEVHKLSNCFLEDPQYLEKGGQWIWPTLKVEIPKAHVRGSK